MIFFLFLLMPFYPLGCRFRGPSAAGRPVSAVAADAETNGDCSAGRGGREAKEEEMLTSDL